MGEKWQVELVKNFHFKMEKKKKKNDVVMKISIHAALTCISLAKLVYSGLGGLLLSKLEM